MRAFIEEKPSLNELYHYGVKGQKWGVRKDRQSSAYVRSSKSNKQESDIKASTLKRIESDVKKYGAMETFERIPTYAYDDSVKIGLLRYGKVDWKTADQKKKDEAWAIEGDLIEEYEKYADRIARK